MKKTITLLLVVLLIIFSVFISKDMMIFDINTITFAATEPAPGEIEKKALLDALPETPDYSGMTEFTIPSLINGITITAGSGGMASVTYDGGVTEIDPDIQYVLVESLSSTSQNIKVIGVAVTIYLKNTSLSGALGAPAIALSSGADVTLIIEGTNILSTTTAGNAGINVPEDTSISILSASGTTSDKLTVTGAKAGIGGNSGQKSGTIIIFSGDITATGSAGAAGIGGGGIASVPADYNNHKGGGGVIKILGGKVTATGNRNGAGIGGGDSATGGDIIIANAQVIARGASGSGSMGGGAGIGGGGDWHGHGGNITILSGTVDAASYRWGAGIGGGGYDGSWVGPDGGNWGGDGGNIIIFGGNITARGYVGTNSGQAGSGIGGGNYGAGGHIVIYGGTVLAEGGSYGTDGGGAGIGSGDEPNNTGQVVEIYGGNVTAIGGGNRSGIGGSGTNAGGTTKIFGGVVTAIGGASGGCGIGTRSAGLSAIYIEPAAVVTAYAKSPGCAFADDDDTIEGGGKVIHNYFATTQDASAIFPLILNHDVGFDGSGENSLSIPAGYTSFGYKGAGATFIHDAVSVSKVVVRNSDITADRHKFIPSADSTPVLVKLDSFRLVQYSCGIAGTEPATEAEGIPTNDYAFSDIEYLIPNIIPALAGYQFTGWLSDDESESFYDIEDIISGVLFYVTADCSLTAHWKRETWPVTFDSGLGTFAGGTTSTTDVIAVPRGEFVTQSAADTELAKLIAPGDAIFAFWSTMETPAGEVSFAGPGQQITEPGVTYYAVYAIKYTVRYIDIDTGETVDEEIDGYNGYVGLPATHIADVPDDWCLAEGQSDTCTIDALGAVYEDNVITFMIKKPTNTPRTGDAFLPGVWTSLMTIGAVGMILTFVMRRKRIAFK